MDKNKPNEPLTRKEVNMLGTYNGEIARGIVHTESWDQLMSELQRRFDAPFEGLRPGAIVPIRRN